MVAAIRYMATRMGLVGAWVLVGRAGWWRDGGTCAR
jgi:hypothetical protein